MKAWAARVVAATSSALQNQGANSAVQLWRKNGRRYRCHCRRRRHWLRPILQSLHQHTRRHRDAAIQNCADKRALFRVRCHALSGF